MWSLKEEGKEDPAHVKVSDFTVEELWEVTQKGGHYNADLILKARDGMAEAWRYNGFNEAREYKAICLVFPMRVAQASLFRACVDGTNFSKNNMDSRAIALDFDGKVVKNSITINQLRTTGIRVERDIKGKKIALEFKLGSKEEALKNQNVHTVSGVVAALLPYYWWILIGDSNFDGTIGSLPGFLRVSGTATLPLRPEIIEQHAKHHFEMSKIFQANSRVESRRKMSSDNFKKTFSDIYNQQRQACSTRKWSTPALEDSVQRLIENNQIFVDPKKPEELIKSPAHVDLNQYDWFKNYRHDGRMDPEGKIKMLQTLLKEMGINE